MTGPKSILNGAPLSVVIVVVHVYIQIKDGEAFRIAVYPASQYGTRDQQPAERKRERAVEREPEFDARVFFFSSALYSMHALIVVVVYYYLAN